MKPRKLFAMLLSLAMIISLIVPAALATEEFPQCPDCTHEAAIDSVHYDTLIKAVSEAQVNDTVTLLKSTSGAGAVIDKNITIDLGGNTYTFTSGVGSTGSESNGFQILKDTAVTLKNGTLNIAEVSANTFYTVIQNYADLTLTDMTLDATYADKWSKVVTDQDSYALSINCGTVVINGETHIIANNDGALAYAFDACKKAPYTTPDVTVDTTGIINGKIEVTGGSLTINNGAFHARKVNGIFTDTDVFVVSSGKLIINNAVVDGGDVEDTTAVWAHTNGEVVINGGTYTLSGKNVTSGHNDMIYAGKMNDGSGATIEINGGSFSATDVSDPGTNGANVWLLNEKDGQGILTVKGGSFAEFNPAASMTEPSQPESFVPSGYYVEEIEGVYTVHNSNTIVGKTVTLAGNLIVPTGGIVVDADTTVNLNGKTVSAPADTAGDGVFHVVSGGTLTINGDGIINGVGRNNYSMAIWADGGQVVINGGTYVNEGAGTDNHYDLIYAKNGGTVEINGGTFTCQTPNWTLNKHDSTNGTISVKGGTFYQYNPAVSNTENPTANFVADGYMVSEDGANYVVKTKNATVVYESNGGSEVASETIDATAENCHFTKPDDPTRSGYTFGGWYCDAEFTTLYDFTSVPTPGDEMTLFAKWTVISSGRRPSNTTTITEKNPDGSSTTTTTNKTTGAVTETTKTPDGVTGVTKTDSDGNITQMQATVPASAAKNNAPVTLPLKVEATESADKPSQSLSTSPRTALSSKSLWKM